MSAQKPITVDEYISQAPESAQEKLTQMRDILKKTAPQAEEILKWGQPAFTAEYILFVYAGFQNHISLHPTLSVITAFKKELTEYKTSDNTVQFNLDTPLPVDLISKMAKLRVKESTEGIKWK